MFLPNLRSGKRLILHASAVCKTSRKEGSVQWKTQRKFVWTVKSLPWNLDKTTLTKSLVSRTIFFAAVIVKYMELNLDITKPRYSEHIFLFLWPFVISRFHCTWAERNKLSSHNAMRFKIILEIFVTSSFGWGAWTILIKMALLKRENKHTSNFAALINSLHFKRRLLYSPFWSGMHWNCFSSCLC